MNSNDEWAKFGLLWHVGQQFPASEINRARQRFTERRELAGQTLTAVYLHPCHQEQVETAGLFDLEVKFDSSMLHGHIWLVGTWQHTDPATTDDDNEPDG